MDKTDKNGSDSNKGNEPNKENREKQNQGAKQTAVKVNQNQQTGKLKTTRGHYKGIF